MGQDDEIIEALIKIQNYCGKFEECDGCKLTDVSGCCGIREKIPTEWNINKEREIKFLL